MVCRLWGKVFQHSYCPLFIRTLCPDALPPIRATEGTIGYDLHATTLVTIPPTTWSLIGTGITVEFPEETYGRIGPHSGLSYKRQIDVAAGVIDPDYQGELKVLLVNNGQVPFKVKKGDCIAQLIVEGAKTPEVILVQDTKHSTWGDAGFGSMGMELELAEIYEISLGHTTSKNIWSQQERYSELWRQIPDEYHDYLDVFDADLVMSNCPLNSVDSQTYSGNRSPDSPDQGVGLTC